MLMVALEEWQYFRKDELPFYVRRRVPVGRRYFEIHSDSNRTEDAPIDTVAIPLGQVQTTFHWLTDGRSSPGRWAVCELQNGAAFFLPSVPSMWRMNRSDLDFDVCLTSEAAGLCATRLAVNRLEGAHADASAHSIQLHQLALRLARFSEIHPEGALIGRVLD